MNKGQQDVGLLFKEAKKIDLAAWIESNLNVKPRMFANGKWRRYSSCPNCGPGSAASVKTTVGHSGYWSCYSCGESGDVVDAAVLFWECTKIEAAYRLVNNVAMGAKTQRYLTEQAVKEMDVASKVKAQALESVLARLRDISRSSGLDREVEAYLSEARALPVSIIRQAVQHGIVGSLPADKVTATKFLLNHFTREQLGAAGLWKTDAKMPGIVYRPLIFFSPDVKSAEFRLIKQPAEKEVKAIRHGGITLPWKWPGTWQGHLIVEGAIDMLSSVALGYRGTIIGLPGCGSWVDHPEWFASVEKGTAAFDNDAGKKANPGQSWASRLTQFFHDNGKILTQHVMPPDKDMNLLLQQNGKGV